MSRTVLTDLITSQPLQTFRSNKFVVRVAFSPNGRYMATASYDHNIVIFEAVEKAIDVDVLDDEDDAALAAEPTLRYVEAQRIRTDSNPEAIFFHPESSYLLYTLRSSHLLYYASTIDGVIVTKTFNPHPMDTHVSFAVLDLAIHPSGKMIACQTGDHRGGAGERILLYGIEPEGTERLACLWTGSEGDDFVLPRMAWLPDGTGLM
jgi:WD40 repeat protein